MKKVKKMPKGMAILKDLDKTINTINPAAKLKMAVRVPDWNIPQITSTPDTIKKILSHLILVVIPIITKAAAVEAALQPYVAASLKVEKYLINDPPFNMCVV